MEAIPAMVGLFVSAYQSQQQSDAQDSAMKKAEEQAKREAFAQEQQLNAMNKKTPNRNANLSANQLAGGLGVGGTDLTKGNANAGAVLGSKALLGL